MHITYISIFPDIFLNFCETSLVKKAQEKHILSFDIVDPRSFCSDTQKQVDDEIYGGGAGMLMKAQPVIDAVKYAMQEMGRRKLDQDKDSQEAPSYKIIFVSPSQDVFTQSTAHQYAQVDELIFVCGRYEGIDHRFEVWAKQTFGEKFSKISLGTFVTLGGELPAMTMTEAIVRLIPGVIKEETSRQEESYSVEHAMANLEYPQYTRPEMVEGLEVPEVLLSGNHAQIAQRRKNTTSFLKD